MKNPGIDLEIWKTLRKKWADLSFNGHKVSVEFQLLSDPNGQKNILAIDAIQTIDDEIVVETVQRTEKAAYATLGLTELSVEQLKETYKKISKPLYLQAKHHDAPLTVTMCPTSSTSGELRGVLEKHNPEIRSSIPVNYQHYYILNALRERMSEQLGKNLGKVTAVYGGDDVKFLFGD